MLVFHSLWITRHRGGQALPAGAPPSTQGIRAASWLAMPLNCIRHPGPSRKLCRDELASPPLPGSSICPRASLTHLIGAGEQGRWQVGNIAFHIRLPELPAQTRHIEGRCSQRCTWRHFWGIAREHARPPSVRPQGERLVSRSRVAGRTGPRRRTRAALKRSVAWAVTVARTPDGTRASGAPRSRLSWLTATRHSRTTLFNGARNKLND